MPRFRLPLGMLLAAFVASGGPRTGAAVAATEDGPPLQIAAVARGPDADGPLLEAYRRLYSIADEVLAQRPTATGQIASSAPSEHEDPESMESINKQLNNPVSSIWSLN